jgi:6,7-dimethyl-8-ribityllumazine synthase
MFRRTEAVLNGEGFRLPIVASRWNEFVVSHLVEGAARALRMHGVAEPEVIWVPGTWEIPIAAHRLLQDGAHGVACVGCILQGATLHAAQLSNAVAGALADLSLRMGKPITWGVLTCATQEEAIERAGMKMGNKGEEAAMALLEVVCLSEGRTTHG